jgi:predicted nucleic-acid-binding Zn-ribbon protein
MKSQRPWKCPKCESTARELGEVRAYGGFWSSFFDVSTRRFKTVACQRCGFTEFYRADIASSSKVFDFLGGG